MIASSSSAWSLSASSRASVIACSFSARTVRLLAAVSIPAPAYFAAVETPMAIISTAARAGAVVSLETPSAVGNPSLIAPPQPSAKSPVWYMKFAAELRSEAVCSLEKEVSIAPTRMESHCLISPSVAAMLERRAWLRAERFASSAPSSLCRSAWRWAMAASIWSSVERRSWLAASTWLANWLVASR